ncbi:MAG: hypothetical protein A2X45_12020 [Lentisphaerae bacterium GWF2_50_93]|nr:MAG: hypothetical protein A2X45_12020 [Lentisphaerae bacterium GWF2_50_93]
METCLAELVIKITVAASATLHITVAASATLHITVAASATLHSCARSERGGLCLPEPIKDMINVELSVHHRRINRGQENMEGRACRDRD